MLEVSTLLSPNKAADHHVGFTDCGEDEFMVVDDNLLDYIDFTSCDVPSFFDADGDILPDLEVDPTELLAEFGDHHDGGAAETKPPDGVVASSQGHNKKEESKKDEKKRLLEEGQKKKNGGWDEVLSAVTKEDDSAAAAAAAVSLSSDTKSSASAAEGRSKKTTRPSKNSHGKRKVDWTPELHRKFVQAVEQLGIDKAVPSRILEIMGIECLTRHNIASHLQKYRSHRKHLMAREAEAASWAQKRQMYAAAPRTKDMPATWVVPTVGFPPPPGVAPPFSRPLHVWGHPPTAAEAAAVWPRHLAPPPWAPVDPAYWHWQYNAARKWGPHAVTQGTPCVPPPMPGMMPRFPAPPPPVPGMMPHPIPMYRPMIPQTTGSGLQLQLDAHPSKESIDAAIGDVLVKPWLPLPLGLKPPSLDSVMSELHKQGISKIPPAATTGG